MDGGLIPSEEVLYSPAPDSMRIEKAAIAKARATPRVSAAGPPWERCYQHLSKNMP